MYIVQHEKSAIGGLGADSICEKRKARLFCMIFIRCQEFHYNIKKTVSYKNKLQSSPSSKQGINNREKVGSVAVQKTILTHIDWNPNQNSIRQDKRIK
jgi:hypothetical protein